MELSHLVFTIQTLAVPPVAIVLFFLARTEPGRYLAYWAAGWGCLVVALYCMKLSISGHATGLAGPLAYSAYLVFEYLFGFLLWAGCREFAIGRPLRLVHAVIVAPALAFGLIGPWVVPSNDHLYPFHAVLFGLFFLFAVWALHGVPRQPGRSHLGLTVIRASLIILGVLFVHYGPVSYWCTFHLGNPFAFEYMVISPMYDALAEVGLALGMAILVTERVRDRLADTNRQLAAALDQLAATARTDAHTGLMNRRAFDALLADPPTAGAVAVLDLNDLKKLNDGHGHRAGDAALQVVARAVRSQFRVTDPAFRVGGDEFVVVLAGGKADDLTERLAAVDGSLTGQRLPDVAGPVDLTVAWGVAEFSPADPLANVVGRADEAMYHCKAERKKARLVGGPTGGGQP